MHHVVWLAAAGLVAWQVALAVGAAPPDPALSSSVTVDALVFAGPFLVLLDALALGVVAAAAEWTTGAVRARAAALLLIGAVVVALPVWFLLAVALLVVTQGDRALYDRLFNLMLFGVPVVAAAGSTLVLTSWAVRRGPRGRARSLRRSSTGLPGG